MRAVNLNREEEMERLHQLAWLINCAGARDKNGKAKYRSFRAFYKPTEETDRFARLKEHLRKEKANGKL